jgi:hypothetical protein
MNSIETGWLGENRVLEEIRAGDSLVSTMGESPGWHRMLIERADERPRTCVATHERSSKRSGSARPLRSPRTIAVFLVPERFASVEISVLLYRGLLFHRGKAHPACPGALCQRGKDHLDARDALSTRRDKPS